jgi:hypothetical protein
MELDLRIWIRPQGNIGNRALEYLAAEGIRDLCPQASIENIELPEWGISKPAPVPQNSASLTLGSHRFWIDAAGLADCLSRGVIDTIIMDSYAQHVDNFPPREICRRLLGAMPQANGAVGFGPDDLLCSLRGNEVLRAIHREYVVLPPEFYAMLARHTGLKLVFFGQIGEDPYITSLKQKLPEARFIPGKSPEFDFETIRRSVNIVPSVSTFAWLAAWLSEASRVILPVAGLFNPANGRTNMLFAEPRRQCFLPLEDETFEYVLFPQVRAVNLFEKPIEFALAQANLASYMQFKTPNQMREICDRLTAFEPRYPQLLGFDPEFYLKEYPEVVDLFKTGLRSAAQHFLHRGFYEGRLPFRFDEEFYLSTYPEVAIAISNGHFENALRHYYEVGRKSGFSPTPR